MIQFQGGQGSATQAQVLSTGYIFVISTLGFVFFLQRALQSLGAVMLCRVGWLLAGNAGMEELAALHCSTGLPAGTAGGMGLELHLISGLPAVAPRAWVTLIVLELVSDRISRLKII